MWGGIEYPKHLQYIPRNMHTVFALLCFVVVIHWLFFPYPSGLLHWHCGNLTIAPVPAKQPWMKIDKYSMWIHYEQLHNHNKAKHNKTVCTFLGIYCSKKHERGLWLFWLWTSNLPVSLGIATYFCFSLIEAALTNIGKKVAYITMKWHNHKKQVQQNHEKVMGLTVHICVTIRSPFFVYMHIS